MNLQLNIPKRIEYKNVTRKQIAQFIQEAEKRRITKKENKTDDVKKWTMPAEPKGFMKCREHDPL